MKEFWEKHKSDIALAALVIYTISLGVAAADEWFKLGIFPTKLDRLIAQSIQKFESQTPGEQAKGKQEILEYGDFAVPQLIKALDQPGPTKDLAIECLKKITDQDFKDPAGWKQWFRQHQSEF